MDLLKGKDARKKGLYVVQSLQIPHVLAGQRLSGRLLSWQRQRRPGLARGQPSAAQRQQLRLRLPVLQQLQAGHGRLQRIRHEPSRVHEPQETHS